MSRPGILWFVLDDASSEHLRQAAPPKYKNLYYHHVTLRYGVEKYEVEEFIGKPGTVEAYAAARNNDAQACRVRTHDLPDEYGVPHVTLSTAPGIQPFASVAMLKSDHEETPLDPPLSLTGAIQFEYLDQIED